MEQETDAGGALSVALSAGEGGAGDRCGRSVEQETDAGAALSVALSAGEAGRRSVSVEQETDAGGAWSRRPMQEGHCLWHCLWVKLVAGLSAWSRTCLPA